MVPVEHETARLARAQRPRTRGGRYARSILLAALLLLAFVAPAASHPNITISGTAYLDEVGTPWTTMNGGGCDGITPNITAVYGGVVVGSTSCDSTTGAWSLSAHTAQPDLGVLVYLDTAGGDVGAAVTRANGSATNITGLSITRDTLRVRSESTTHMTSGILSGFDADQDPDVPFTNNGSLLTPSTVGIIVEAGSTFSIGTVTTGSFQVDGATVGGAGTLTLTGSGTSPSCTPGTGVQMPLCVNGGTFDPPLTTRFAGAGATSVAGIFYRGLNLAPSGASNPTYDLGSALGQTVRTTTLTVGDGTNPVTASTTAHAPNLIATGGITVATNATLGGSGGGAITAHGSISGTGSYNLTGGSTELRAAAGGAISGSATLWTFHHLTLSNSTSTPSIVSTATGTVLVLGDLTVGRDSDLATTVLDNSDGTDVGFDIDGDLVVTSHGSLRASALRPVTVGGDFMVTGTYTHNGGTLTFDGPGPSALQWSAPTALGKVVSETPGKSLYFDHLYSTTVTSLTTAGSSCTAGQVSLRSSQDGSPFTLTAGSTDLTYTSVKDSIITTPATSHGGTDLGGNGPNWTFAPCRTISGTAYADEAGQPWTVPNGGACDSTTPNVAIAVNGRRTAATTCNAATGSWTTQVALPQADKPIVAYLDTAGGDQGAVVTRNADTSSAITGLSITRGNLRVRSESGSQVGTADLDSWDGHQDSDLPHVVTTGVAISTAATVGIVVEAGATFYPGVPISVGSVQVHGTWRVGGLLTLVGSGTNPSCAAAPGIQAPLCFDGGSTTGKLSAVFAGVGTTSVTAAPSYANLKIAPTAGNPTVYLGTGPGEQVTADALTVGNEVDAVTVSTSAHAPDVVAGYIHVAANATLGGSGASTTTVAGGYVQGAGSINFSAGTFEQRLGVLDSTFGQIAGSNTWTFNNLTFSNSSGAPRTATLTAGGTAGLIRVNRTLTIGRPADGGAVIVDGNVNDHAFDVNADLRISVRGTFIAPSSKEVTIAEDFSNDGSFIHSSGTVTIDGTTDSQLTYSNPTTFATMRIATPDKTVRFDHLATTVVGRLDVTGTSCSAGLVHLRSTQDGSQFTLSATTSSIRYADVRDALATSPIGALGVDGGNNSANWSIACGPLSVSGTVTTDEAGAPWIPANGGACDGITPNVSVSHDGVAPVSVPCNAVTGAWTAPVYAHAADRPLVAYLDTGGGARGAVITRNADVSSGITGLSLTVNQVRVRSESATAIGNDDVDRFDGDQDPDVPVTATLGALDTSPGVGVLVEAGDTFAATGNLSMGSLDVRGTWAGGTQLTLTSGGTNAVCSTGPGVQVPLCLGGGSSFTAPAVTSFTGTSDFSVSPAGYAGLTIAPAGAGGPTVHLGTAPAQTLTAAAVVLGNGTNPVTVTTTTFGPDTNATSLQVAAGAALSGSGAGSITVTGSATGAGAISLTGGSFEQRLAAAGSLGQTAGSTTWTFRDLTVSNSTGVPLVSTTAAGGLTGTIQVTNDLAVGRPGDAAATTLNNNVNDHPVDVDGDLVISSSGVLQASNTRVLTVGSDFTNNGTFTSNSGTVTFDGATASTLLYAAPTTFGTLTSSTSGKTLTFDHLDQTTVGTLNLNGNSCSSGQVNLRSALDGTPFTIAATTSLILNATIKDATITTASTAHGSTSLGGNGANWTFTGCATISGTATVDESGTPWTPGNGGACDGVTQNVVLVHNGGPRLRTTCDGTTGAWSTTTGFAIADRPLLAYLDTNGGDRGASVTRNATTTGAVAGLDVTRDRVRVRTESATAMTNAMLDLFDSGQDGDVPYTVAGAVLTAPASVALIVGGAPGFAPGGNVSVGSLQVDGVFTGSGTLTLTGSGTDASCSSGPGTQVPLCINGGTFTAPPTTRFAGTGASAVTGLATYATLQVSPAAAGSPTVQLGSAAGQTVTATAITVGDGVNPVVASTTSHAPNVASGTISVAAQGTLGGSGSGTITATGNVTGAGTVNLTGGAFEQRLGAAANFGQNGASTNVWTFHHLSFTNSTGVARQATASPGSTARINALGNLTIGNPADAANTTFDFNITDHPLDVDGDATITTRGVLQASNSAVMSVGGSFVRLGTFSPNGGVLSVDGTGTSSLTASTFATLRLNTPDKTVRFDNLAPTTVANLQVTGTSCGSGLVSLRSAVDGAQFTLNVTSATITGASIRDSLVTTAVTARGTDDGNNGANWTFLPCSTPTSVGGTVFVDEVGTPWTVPNGGACDGITPNVSVTFVGGAKTSTSCNAVTGAWSLSVTQVGSDRPLMAYLDTGGGHQGAVITHTVSEGAAIAGLDISQDTLRVGSESGSAVTSNDIDLFDSGSDPDVPVTASFGTVTLSPGIGLIVEPGGTLDATTGFAGVAARSVDLAGTIFTTSLTLTGNGSSTNCLDSPAAQVPLCLVGGTLGATTVSYQGRGAVTGTAYDQVVVTPPSGQTVSLGTAPGQIFNANAMSITLSGSAGTVEATTFEPDVVATSFDVAGSSFVSAGDSDFLVEVMFGSGSVAITGGLVEQRMSVARSFGPTSGADWVLNDLVVSNSSGAPLQSTVTSGAGRLTVGGDLTIGKAGDLATSTLNINTNDKFVRVVGDATITADGALLASNTQTLQLEGDFTRTGTFTHNGGTVSFAGATPSTLTYAGPTSFGTLLAAAPSKTLRFDHLDQTSATTLTVRGTGCGTGEVNLRSALDGTQFTIAATNSSVQYASIKDSAITSATVAGGSTDAGNNGANWTIQACMTVGGTIYDDESGTPWTPTNGGGCDGITPVVRVSVNGTSTQSTSCNAATGTFVMLVGLPAQDNTLLAYLDTGGGHSGASFVRTVSGTANINGLDVTRNVLSLRSESAAPVTNALLDRIDSAQDSDIPFAVNSSNLAAPSSVGTRVLAGTTFAPGGTVATGSLRLEGSFTGAGALTLLSGGTNANCASVHGTRVPLCMAGGASFTAPTTTIFQASTTYHVAGLTYATLELCNQSGGMTAQLGTAPGQTVTATTLIRLASGACNATVQTSAFSPDVVTPLLDVVNGKIEGSGTGTITAGAMYGTSGIVDLTAGTVDVRMTTASNFGNTVASPWSFHNLAFSNTTAGSLMATTNASAAALVVRGDLTIGRASDIANTTYNNNINDRLMDVDGNVTITSKGTFVASNFVAMSVAANFTNNGTFLHNGGITTFDGNAPAALTYAAATNFGTVNVTTPSKELRFDHLRQTTISVLNVTGGSCTDGSVSLRSTLPGSQYTIAIATANITYATITDSIVTTAKTANASTNGGNNGANWTFAAGCVQVAGNTYVDEAGSVWNAANGGGCDGITPNVSLVFNGGTKASTSCHPVTGAWAFSVALTIPDRAVLVFIDDIGGDRGAVLTRNLNTTSNITGLQLTQDRYRFRSESGTAVTSAQVDMYDAASNSRVPMVYTPDSGFGASLSTIGTPIEVIVEAGATFTMTEDAYFGNLQVEGTFTGSAHTLVLTGSGTGTAPTGAPGAQMPLLRTGTFTPPTAVSFRGSGAYAVTGTVTYNALSIIDYAAGTTTTHLGSAPAQTITAASLSTSTNLGADLHLTTSTHSPTVAISGSVSIDANATLEGSGTGLFRVGGAFTGTGGISFSNGTVEQRLVAADAAFGRTGLGTPWTFNDLRFSNGGGAPRQATLASAGDSSGISVRGDLMVGAGGDAATTALAADALNRWVDVDGNVTIVGTGVLLAPTSGALRIGGNFSNDGSFIHGGGTVQLDGVGTSALTYAAPQAFGALQVLTPLKTVRFDHLQPTTVTSLAVDGASCATRANLRSTLDGTQFTLTAASASVAFASVRDANSTNPIAATGSQDAGNNSVTWQIGSCITVSGTATADEAGTPWNAGAGGSCDGATHNISASWDGADPVSTSCDATTGAWSLEVGVGASNRAVAVYLNTNGGARGLTVTRSLDGSSPIAGVTVTAGRVRVRSESTSPLTNFEVGRFDQREDADVPAIVDAGALTAPNDVELLVEAGETYAPTGNVTVGNLQVDGTYTGGPYQLTLTDSGTTNACTGPPAAQVPLCVAGGGSFTAPSTTVFAGTAASSVQGVTFGELRIAPAGPGSPTVQLGSGAGQTITASSIALGTGSNPVTATTSSFAPTIATTGALTVAAGATLAGSGSGAITIGGDVTGAGAVALTGGSFEQRGSAGTTFGRNAGAGAWAFNALTLSTSGASSRTVAVPSGSTGALVTAGTLQVGRASDTATTTFDLATNDRALDANAAVTTSVRGALLAPPSASFTVAGDLTNFGSFVHGGGTLTIDGAGTSKLLHAAATTFHNLRIATPAKTVEFDHLYRTNVVGASGTYPGLTVDGTACGTPVGLVSDLLGAPFELNVTGSSNVQYALVRDSTAVSALTGGNSVSGGGNTNWTLGGACGPNITLGVTTGPTSAVAPSALLPGEEGSAQSTLHVETASPGGYEVTATDASNTAAMVRDLGGGTVDDWTDSDPAPGTWAPGDAGTNGRFGVTVLSATGGRLAKWGPGTSVATDFGTNAYLGLRTSTSLLHASNAPGVGDIVVAYRVTPSASNPTGAYTATVTYTATALP